jgi:hypothetical protein
MARSRSASIETRYASIFGSGGTGRPVAGTIVPDDDETAEEVGSLGGVGDSCKYSSPSDGDEACKGAGTFGGVGDSFKYSCPSDGDEVCKEAGPLGGVGGLCKSSSPSDGDEAGPLGGVCDSCKYSSPDGDEAYKGCDPSCGSGKECTVAGPSSGGGECEVVDSSGAGEDGEAVASSDLDWCCSFDMTAAFPTAVGTARPSRASYISRTTGAPSTRLKMERMRRI